MKTILEYIAAYASDSAYADRPALVDAHECLSYSCLFGRIQAHCIGKATKNARFIFTDEKRNIVEVSNDISSWQNSQPKRGRYVRRHGRRVWVPYKNQPATAASKRKRRGGSGGNTAYHNISGGETLSSIAKKYHTSVKHLQKINGIKGTNIRSGEKIKVK